MGTPRPTALLARDHAVRVSFPKWARVSSQRDTGLLLLCLCTGSSHPCFILSSSLPVFHPAVSLPVSPSFPLQSELPVLLQDELPLCPELSRLLKDHHHPCNQSSWNSSREGPQRMSTWSFSRSSSIQGPRDVHPVVLQILVYPWDV